MDAILNSEMFPTYIFLACGIVSGLSFLWVVIVAFRTSAWLGVLTFVLSPVWYLFSLINIKRCWFPLLLNLAAIGGFCYATLLVVERDPDLKAILADADGEITLDGLANLDLQKVVARIAEKQGMEVEMGEFLADSSDSSDSSATQNSTTGVPSNNSIASNSIRLNQVNHRPQSSSNAFAQPATGSQRIANMLQAGDAMMKSVPSFSDMGRAQRAAAAQRVDRASTGLASLIAGLGRNYSNGSSDNAALTSGASPKGEAAPNAAPHAQVSAASIFGAPTPAKPAAPQIKLERLQSLDSLSGTWDIQERTVNNPSRQFNVTSFARIIIRGQHAVLIGGGSSYVYGIDMPSSSDDKNLQFVPLNGGKAMQIGISRDSDQVTFHLSPVDTGKADYVVELVGTSF